MINILDNYKIVLVPILILVLLVSGLALAQVTNDDSIIHINFDEVEWQPCIGLAGCEGMILRGDPASQPTDQIWRLEAGTEFPAHYHISPEHIVGISGELVFMVGEDEVRVGSGDFLYSPSRMTHEGFCAEGEPCVYFVYDDFPVDFNLVEQMEG